jgi:hypothetical protein
VELVGKHSVLFFRPQPKSIDLEFEKLKSPEQNLHKTAKKIAKSDGV